MRVTSGNTDNREKKQHFDNQVTTAIFVIQFKQPYAELDLKKPLTTCHWNGQHTRHRGASHSSTMRRSAAARIRNDHCHEWLEYFWRLDGDTMEFFVGLLQISTFFGFANAQYGLPSAGWCLVLGPRLKACWPTLKLTTPCWRLLWVGGFWHSWCLLVLWFETFGKIQLIWIHKWVR